MANAMKYIKVLEAAGIERKQAEAQVQIVIEAIEDDLITKHDFLLFQERLENRFSKIDGQFTNVEGKFIQLEYKIITKLGAVVVSTISIAVAVLTWVIKTR